MSEVTGSDKHDKDAMFLSVRQAWVVVWLLSIVVPLWLSAIDILFLRDIASREQAEVVKSVGRSISGEIKELRTHVGSKIAALTEEIEDTGDKLERVEQVIHKVTLPPKSQD